MAEIGDGGAVMPEAEGRSRLRRLVPMLLMMAMVGPLTLNVLQPAMPSLVRYFGAPRESVQLTLSLYIFGMALAQMIGGPLADRFGRRPVVLAGLALYTLSSLAGMFAPSLDLLIVSRVAQAFGATACLALSRTIIGDVSDRATTARVIAYVTMVMVVAPMAAPNLGAALDARFDWRAIFAFCALFGALVLATLAFGLFETRPEAMRGATYSEVARRSAGLVRNPAFMRYAGLSAFASACFFIFLGASPHLVIEAMGRSPQEFGLWYIVLGVGYSLGNLTVARCTHLIGTERMMALGSVLLLIGVAVMIGLALVPVMHPAAVFLPAVFFTYGNGLVLPHSMAAAIQTDRNAAGAASGLVGCSQMLAGAILSYVVSKMPGETPLAMALMMFASGLVSMAMLPRWRKPPAG